MQKIVEYSQVNEGNRSQATKLRDAPAHSWGYARDISLWRHTAGYEPAGSMARYINACYRVRWIVGDQNWSQAFKTFEEAVEFFDQKIAARI